LIGLLAVTDLTYAGDAGTALPTAADARRGKSIPAPFGANYPLGYFR